MTINILIYATLIISLLGMVNTPNVFLFLTFTFSMLSVVVMFKRDLINILKFYLGVFK